MNKELIGKLLRWAVVGMVAPFLIATGAPASDVLRIGAPMSLTGRYVTFGPQDKRGIETAIETWKAVRGDRLAGRNIELLIRDTQSSNSITVSIMNELMQSDKVDVIIGPDGSDVTAAAVPSWKKVADRPIWVIYGATSSKIEQEVGDDPYVFHTTSWAYDYAKTYATALKTMLGSNKKVAIIYSDGAYGRSYADFAPKYLKAAGFTIVANEIVREGAIDFTSTLVKVQAAHPDILYAIVQVTDAIQITKQIYTMKLHIPYLMGQAFPSQDEWRKTVGDLQSCWTGIATWLPGLSFPADPREPKLFPSAADWEAKWRAKYHKEPEYLEVEAYVGTMLYLLAVEKANSVNRDQVAAAFAAEDYSTLLGRSKFERSNVMLHQAFSKMIVFQNWKETNGFKGVVLYPSEIAQGKLRSCP